MKTSFDIIPFLTYSGCSPLFGYASIHDPLFVEYKTVIDERHLIPAQAFENKFGEKLHDGTVISMALPLSDELISGPRLSLNLGWSF